MNRLFFPIIAVPLVLSACMPSTVTLIPPETLVVQTLAAMPKTNTPLPTSTQLPTATATIQSGLATPNIDLSIPGAYCLPTNTTRSRGLVTKVISGDTIEVLITNQTYRVRYIGVVSPSMLAPAEWQAGQSMSYNQNLVEGKYVTLVQDASDQDAEANFPRYVLIDQTFVNYEMIRQGYSRLLSIPPNTSCDPSLLAAQVEAQTNVRGVWIPTPMPTFTITSTPTITRTPTKTSVPVCNCLGKSLTCNSFRSQGQAQRCFEYCQSMGYGDIFGLDKNRNGLACEGSS
jgi:endonuclease YncB( thermonuclease family)